MPPYPTAQPTPRTSLTGLLLILMPFSSWGGPEKPETEQVPKGQATSTPAKGEPAQVPSAFQVWLSPPDRIWEFGEAKIAHLRTATLIGENTLLRDGVVRWVEALEKQTPDSEKAHERRVSLRHLRLILKQSWGEPAGPTPVLQACLTALKSEKLAKAPYGTLEKFPATAWRILKDIAVSTLSPKVKSNPQKGNPFPDLALWRQVVSVVLTHPVGKDYSHERYELFQLALKVEGLIDEPTLAFLLGSSFEDTSIWAADIYATRGHREKLAELGLSLTQRGQLNTLWVLSQRSYRSRTADPFAPEVDKTPVVVIGPRERKLWQQVFHDQPFEACAKFGDTPPTEIVDYISALDSVRSKAAKVLQDCLLKGEDFDVGNRPDDPFSPLPETNKDEDSPYAHLEAGVLFLGKTLDSKNIPLLRSFLNFRGYRIAGEEYESKGDDEEGKTVWQTRHFGVRKLAAESLKEMGEPVPDGLVFETKVKLPPRILSEHEISERFFRGTEASLPRANHELPPQVVVEDGKLTLFADYAHPDDQGLPLYLVNRTSQAIGLPAEDGDLEIKLERQLPSGEWERAQVRLFPFCGNSYGVVSLPAGMFFQLHGYQPQPKFAQSANIRFVCYNEKVPFMSNPGPGFFSPVDVAKAKGDHLAQSSVPDEFQKGFRDPYDTYAPDLSGCIACLRIAELVGEFPGLRSRAQEWLSKLEEFPDPTAEEEKTIALAKSILARDWGEMKGLGSLVQGCLEGLRSDAQASKEFGSLGRHPRLVWTVIGEAAWIETRPALFGSPPKVLDRKLWREVLDLSVEQAIKAQPIERHHILSALECQILADEILPDEPFERLLQVDDEQMTRTAAAALVRRSQWEKLAELALKMPNDRKVIATLVMAEKALPLRDQGRMIFDGPRPRKPGPLERELWEQVVKTQPVQLAAALSGYREPLHSAELLRNEVRAYWRAELKRCEAMNRDFELTKDEAKLTYSLEFLARSRLPEDIELLRSLLGYRGYEKFVSTYVPKGKVEKEAYETRRFSIRLSVSNALRDLGQSVPKDIILQLQTKPDGTPL